MNILIPMAGAGSRFKIKGYDIPKPLIKVGNKLMVELAVESLDIEGQYIFIVRKYENEEHNILLKETLNKITDKPIIYEVDYLTEGATATCLLAKESINNNEPLIITNCDQVLDWSSDKFINSINEEDDGVVITYDSSSPKNSYIKVDEDGLGLELAEKKPISNLALIGLHYWKHGKDFIVSAEELISRGNKSGNEYYIAPTYNILIENSKKIRNYHFESGQYHSLGSPEDYKNYLGKQREYKQNKPKIIICDLDGTILKHSHRFSVVTRNKAEILPGVLEKFDEWDSTGCRIILMTGRKESAREMTEKDLRELGLCWDQLIMNVGNGARVLINDKLTKWLPDRAISVNVETDKGFETIDWEEIGI